MNNKILVVDDEKAIVDILEFNLKREGYEVLKAYNGEDAIQIQNQADPDLVMLDIMMPKVDGLTACKKIREVSNVPIILLTAKAEEVDKVIGLEFGADDYITKPFSIRETMARVKANLRRTVMQNIEHKDENTVNIHNITIDTERYEVKKNDEIIDLTVREFELLVYLAQSTNQIFTREQLLEKVWGYEYYGDLRTVDVTVRRLREKVEDNPASPQCILTKRGIGYYCKA